MMTITTTNASALSRTRNDFSARVLGKNNQKNSIVGTRRVDIFDEHQQCASIRGRRRRTTSASFAFATTKTKTKTKTNRAFFESSSGRCWNDVNNSTLRRPRLSFCARATMSDDSTKSDITVVPGDYRVGATLATVSLFLGPVCHLWFPQFFVHALLGAFLSFQASRVRFRFSETDLDVVFIQPGESDEDAAKATTETSGDNKLQGGGANKWSFESVQNWEFWFPGFPVLVYYKENQTRAEGQPHFFPIIMDGKKLYEEMLTKMPKSVNEKPSLSEWNLLTAFKSTPVGRNIIEQMSDEQVKWCEETTGLPYFDDEKK
jgi:hypothetical protein